MKKLPKGITTIILIVVFLALIVTGELIYLYSKNQDSDNPGVVEPTQTADIQTEDFYGEGYVQEIDDTQVVIAVDGAQYICPRQNTIFTVSEYELPDDPFEGVPVFIEKTSEGAYEKIVATDKVTLEYVKVGDLETCFIDKIIY